MDFVMGAPWWGRKKMVLMAASRRGGRGRGWGPPGGGGFPMGPPWMFIHGRPKMERGGVRAAILRLLAEEPMHGYQIIQELSERTGGMWQPSPGAVYPTLQQLDDEGLVKSEEREGKKVYALTPEGRAQVDSLVEAPWERFCRPDEDLASLRDLAIALGGAVMQVVAAGDEDQRAKTKEVLEEARRKIYQMLAEPSGD
jgi:DNA-binding PadR family transcriptional regulator